MTSQPKRRRQQQQRLTFETANVASSPGQEGLSPARVRIQPPQEASPNTRPVRPLKMVRPKKPKQQTLESSMAKVKTPRRSKKQSPGEDQDVEMLPVSIGNAVQVRRRQAASSPPSSFMSKSRNPSHRVVDIDSETSVEEDVGIDDTDGEGPLRHEVPRRNLSRPSKKQKRSDASTDSTDDTDGDENNIQSSQSLPAMAVPSDDSDDAPLVTPRSSARHKKNQRVVDVDDDDDDDVIQTPAKRRKLGSSQARKPVSVNLSDDSDPPLPGTSLRQTTPENRTFAGPDSSARKTRSSARKGHRSEKEKRMELLRRRRAGEKELTMTDLETEEDEEEERGALYDTDSDHQALDYFDDESEPEPDAPTKKSNKNKKKGRLSNKRSAAGEGEDEDEDTENSEGNLASFIDDEDDTIGIPEEALYHMPLQFTSASRKPLKSHFKDAVEWLIHRRINPAFERDDEVYRTAWTRLNDEVMGLANSKFISAVWRPEFYRALKARPYYETAELGAGDLATEMEKCQACGRSGHPATWVINFKGKPYDNWTLDEIEKETDVDDSDGDYDADGNSLPAENKQFFVGANCNSNAETAHCLLHWKPALRDWVDEFLEKGGWLVPEKLAERDRMKARKRRKLADEIVEDCDRRDIIKRLYADFKQNIELAQTKDTSKTARGGRRYVK